MRVGEIELRDTVVEAFKKAGRGYILSDTKRGFNVHPTDIGLVYVVEHYDTGWILYVEVKDDDVYEMDFLDEGPYSELMSKMDEVNYRHYTFSETVKNHIDNQFGTIATAMKIYQSKLIKTTHQDNEWVFHLKRVKGKTPRIKVKYATGLDFWDIHFENFMDEYRVYTELYDIHQTMETAVESCNKENMRDW